METMRIKPRAAFTRRGAVAAAMIFAFEFIAYFPPTLIKLYPAIDMTLPWDALIPFVPAMIIPYLLVFAEWIYFFMLSPALERARSSRFLGAAVGGFFIALLCFVFIPSTYTRPDIPAGSGALASAVSIMYGMDQVSRCIPSLHCFITWLCYILVRGRREVPLGLRALALGSALITFCSTLLVKQHVIVDIPAGALLAELCWAVAPKTPLPRWLASLYDKLCSLFIKGAERKSE